MSNWNPFSKFTNVSNKNFDLLKYHQYEYGLYDEFGLQNMSVEPNMNNPRFVKIRTRNDKPEFDFRCYNHEQATNEQNRNSSYLTGMQNGQKLLTENVSCAFTNVENVLGHPQEVFSECNYNFDSGTHNTFNLEENCDMDMKGLDSKFANNWIEHIQRCTQRGPIPRLHCCSNCALLDNEVITEFEKATQTDPIHIISHELTNQRISKDTENMLPTVLYKVKNLINYFLATESGTIYNIGMSIKVLYRTLLTVSGVISVYFFLDYVYSEWILPQLNSQTYIDYIVENMRKILGEVQNSRIKNK